MTIEEFKNLEIGDWVRESDEHYNKNVIFAPVPYRERMRGDVIAKKESELFRLKTYDIFNEHVIGVGDVCYRDFEIEAKQKDESNILRTKITLEELQEAATPLVELLRKKGHPHMTVLVTDWNVELVEALRGIPMPYED